MQTFQSQPNAALTSVISFVSEYEDNIRNAVIPPTQLPIYVNNYYVSSSPVGGTGITVSYSTMELQPTNVFSKRIWNIHVHGTIVQDTVNGAIEFVFYDEDTENNALENISSIGFEGLMSGTFLLRSSPTVENVAEYWTYNYSSSSKTLTLFFVNNPLRPLDISTNRVFDIYFNIPNLILTSCQSGTMIYPPDNLKNTYCVHNSSASGAYGGFAVSGDVVYRDYGQNYRLTPSFLGSRYKLLLTLTKADPSLQENVGNFFGPIFAITYVGGPLGQQAYITFENKTSSRVCVWTDPSVFPDNTNYTPTHTFVDPGKNTVAYTIALSNIFRYYDGQFDPCFPLV